MIYDLKRKYAPAARKGTSRVINFGKQPSLVRFPAGMLVPVTTFLEPPELPDPLLFPWL